MKRFTVSKKLKESMSSPKPPEVQREVSEKIPFWRKYFLQIVIVIFMILFVWFVFNVLYREKIKGLVKFEKITLEAPVSGTFIALASDGEVVERNHVIGKIINPELDEKIKALKDELTFLEKLKKDLEKEKQLKNKMIAFNQLLTIYNLPDRKSIQKRLSINKNFLKQLEQQISLLEKRVSKIEELIKVGSATEFDLDKVRGQLFRLQRERIDLEMDIEKLQGQLRKLDRIESLFKTVNPENYSTTSPEVANVEILIRKAEKEIEILKKKLHSTQFSFPFDVQVVHLLPSNSYVFEGSTVGRVINLNSFYVKGYIPPEILDDVFVGRKVNVILPDGKKLKGIIEGFGAEVVPKPAMLVGSLEKKRYVLPVKIRLTSYTDFIKNNIYENMPVEIELN
ncbi:HlyD family secretion protein [Persephonella sp.]